MLPRAEAAWTRSSIQSFDWAVLRLVRAAEPEIALNALTNTDYLEVDQPGASPWLGGDSTSTTSPTASRPR